MPDISVSLGNKQAVKTLSAGQIVRVQGWASKVYATIPNPNYVPGQVPLQPRVIANPDPLQTAADEHLKSLFQTVREWERQQSKASVPEPADL